MTNSPPPAPRIPWMDPQGIWEDTQSWDSLSVPCQTLDQDHPKAQSKLRSALRHLPPHPLTREGEFSLWVKINPTDRTASSRLTCGDRGLPQQISSHGNRDFPAVSIGIARRIGREKQHTVTKSPALSPQGDTISANYNSCVSSAMAWAEQ